MSMPKGHKSKFGYATVSSEEGCRGYREIAEIMTEDGDKMNHSTARNVFLRAMQKIASSVCNSYERGEADKMAQDPRFQSAIHEIVASM